MIHGAVAPAGTLTAQLDRADGTRELRYAFDRIMSGAVWPSKELTIAEIGHYGLPRNGLPDEVNAWRTSNFRNLLRGAKRALTARKLGLSNFYGTLFVSHTKANGDVLDYGLASLRVVTNAGVGFIVDAFQGSTELENMRYHGVGTGNTAEAAGDTALVAESTTILDPNSTRATGTLAEAASNIFRTVGAVAFDGSGAIVEHGIFSQAATGGGVLLDRSVFSALNVISGDGITFTYDLTLAAGS